MIATEDRSGLDLCARPASAATPPEQAVCVLCFEPISPAADPVDCGAGLEHPGCCEDAPDGHGLDEQSGPAARAEAKVRRLLTRASDEYLDGAREAVAQSLRMLGDPTLTEVTWSEFSAGLDGRSDDYRDAVVDYFGIFVDLCAAVRAARTDVLQERISVSVREMHQAADVDDATMSDWARGVVADSRELDDLMGGGVQ